MNSFQVGDIVQAKRALYISNNDGTEEQTQGGDIFMLIEENDDVDECVFIRQKSLKISSWSRHTASTSFKKVKV